MKKLVRGRRYDTETTKQLGRAFEGNENDSDYWSETLYVKSTGEFFLYCEGGSESRYAQRDKDGLYTASKDITPLSYGEAEEWASEHLDHRTYDEYFGELDEISDKGKTTISLSLTNGSIKKLKRLAAIMGKPISEVAEYLISTAKVDER